MKRNILFGLSFLLMMTSLYLVFIYVPTEKEMGIVQRIFYLMVPMGWLALLAFFLIFVGSILFLWRRQSKWDIFAQSSAEVGFVFTTLALLVGSMWAKPIWGVWWTWEARLTATLVLWLIYLAYFLVRAFATEKSRGATFAAVVGIVGFIDIPIVALATTLWRGMHPPPIIFQGGITPPMLLTLIVSIFAFTALYFVLLVQRISIRNDEIELARLKKSS